MPLLKTGPEVSHKCSWGVMLLLAAILDGKRFLLNTAKDQEVNCRWLFSPSIFVFPSSCRGGKGSYKKAGRTNRGLCKCEALPVSWAGWMPSGGFLAEAFDLQVINHPLATTAVSRPENMSTQYSMICL